MGWKTLRRGRDGGKMELCAPPLFTNHKNTWCG